MAKFGLILASIALLVGIFSTSSIAQLQGLFISETPLTWEESREYCHSLGKELISIHTEAFDRSLVETLSDVDLPGNLWTSGQEVTEGVWIWNSTGEPFYHTRWFIGQPDANGTLNCFYLATRAHLYWRDADCNAPMNFICEDPLTVEL